MGWLVILAGTPPSCQKVTVECNQPLLGMSHESLRTWGGDTLDTCHFVLMKKCNVYAFVVSLRALFRVDFLRVEGVFTLYWF